MLILNEDVKAEYLCSALKNLRDPMSTHGDSWEEASKDMLKQLGFETSKWTTNRIDAFLIKAVHEKFGTLNIETDIMLMALGLMDGYDHNCHVTKKIADRRAKYLRETDYLSNESIPYDDANKNIKSTYQERLRKSEEDPRFLLLAKSILSHKNNMEEYITETNDYIAKIGKNEIAILPTPSYVVREAYQNSNHRIHLFKNITRNNINSDTVKNVERPVIKITIVTLVEVFLIVLLIWCINTRNEFNHIYENGHKYNEYLENDGSIWTEADPSILSSVK